MVVQKKQTKLTLFGFLFNGHQKGVFYTMEYSNKVTWCFGVYNVTKPKEDVGLIQTKKNSKVIEVTPERLAGLLTNGNSIHSAVCNMKQDDLTEATAKTFKKDSFLYQNVFMLDIDHGDFTQEDILNRSIYSPNIIYQTYSSCHEAKRWRVIYFANKTVDDIKTTEKVNSLLMTPFLENLEGYHAENADTKTFDATRICYCGQKEGLYVDNDSRFNPFELLSNKEVQKRYNAIIPTTKFFQAIKRNRNRLAKKAYSNDLISEEEYNEFLKLKDSKITNKSRYDRLTQMAKEFEKLILEQLQTTKDNAIDPSVIDNATGEILTDFEIETLDELKNIIFNNLKKFNSDKAIKELSYDEANEYLSQLPLHELVGVPLNSAFKCFFHHDSTPSAGIFMGRNGTTLYKCLSDSCGVVLNTHSFLMTLMNQTSNKLRRDKIQELLLPMGIRLIRNDYEKEAKIQLADSASFLSFVPNDDEAKAFLIRYNLHEYYYALVRYANTLVVDEPLKMTGDEVVIHASFSEIHAFMRNDKVPGTSDLKNLKKKTKFLGFVGLFQPVPHSELKPEFYHISIVNKKKANHKLKSYYQFPVIDEFSWEQIRSKIILFKKSGLKMDEVTIKHITFAFGTKNARETFVQSKITDELSSKEAKLLNQMLEQAEKLLQDQHYFTFEQLLRKVDVKYKLYKTKTERYNASKPLFHKVKNKLQLDEFVVNRTTRKEFNIPEKIKSRTPAFKHDLGVK